MANISFEEFTSNVTIMTVKEAAEALKGDEEYFNAPYVRMYPGFLYIEDYCVDGYVHKVSYTVDGKTTIKETIGRYHLILGRNEWLSDDLNDLEYELYTFGKESGAFED